MPLQNLVSKHLNMAQEFIHSTRYCIVEDVQQRWKALRDRFVRELEKIKKPTGSAAKTMPDWNLLEHCHMMFFRDFIKHKKYIPS